MTYLKRTPTPPVPAALHSRLTQREAIVNKSPRPIPAIRCVGCDHTWTATGAAHCAACHTAPFSTARLFDLHRSTRGGEHGSCLDPAQILNRSGERIMLFRDGMWRGPEMTEEQKTARFGDRGAA